MQSKTSSIAFLRFRPIFRIHIGLVSRIGGDVIVGSRYMDLCRPRTGRNELGDEWKNNVNYVAWSSCTQLVSPG